MNIKRIGVFGASLLSGVAAYAVLAAVQPAPTPAVAVQPAPTGRVEGPATVDLLVAARDLPIGAKLAASDVRWVKTVEGSHPASAILHRSADDAARIEADIVGSVARQGLLAGEAISLQRLAKGTGSLLAFSLPDGKRAVAVDIDARGSRSAGNFIMPGDHVDVLAIEAAGAGSAKSATTLMRDIRVLAVGPHLGADAMGGTPVTGDTVTLELDPAQAERIAGAAVGTIKLALRPRGEAGDAYAGTNLQMMTVRYGIARKQ